MPPRHNNSDLVGAACVFMMALVFAALSAAMNDDSTILGFSFAQGCIAGFWWADYWRKRDRWRTWKARQTEQEDSD